MWHLYVSMNREYNGRVLSKNSERLLKNLQNTTGDYFFWPHPVELPTSLPTKLTDYSLFTISHLAYFSTCKQDVGYSSDKLNV